MTEDRPTQPPDDIRRALKLAGDLTRTITNAREADPELTPQDAVRALALIFADRVDEGLEGGELTIGFADRALTIFGYYVLASFESAFPDRVARELAGHIAGLRAHLEASAAFSSTFPAGHA